MKKILIALLVLTMAIPFAACNDKKPGGDIAEVPTMALNPADNLTQEYSSIDELLLNKYVLEYDVQKYDGITKETTTSHCIELAYYQTYLVSYDGGVTYRDDVRTSAFQCLGDAKNPARELFSTHVAYRLAGKMDTLTEVGTEEIAGMTTTHYQTSDGKLNTVDFYVTSGDDAKYDLTLKYTKNTKTFDGSSRVDMDMTVTKIDFDIPEDEIKTMMQNAMSLLATPEPTEIPTPAPEA